MGLKSKVKWRKVFRNDNYMFKLGQYFDSKFQILSAYESPMVEGWPKHRYGTVFLFWIVNVEIFEWRSHSSIHHFTRHLDRAQAWSRWAYKDFFLDFHLGLLQRLLFSYLRLLKLHFGLDSGIIFSHSFDTSFPWNLFLWFLLHCLGEVLLLGL